MTVSVGTTAASSRNSSLGRQLDCFSEMFAIARSIIDCVVARSGAPRPAT